MNLLTEPYDTATKTWPSAGKVILAQFDHEGIWVYQAFKPEIAMYASQHKRFEGAPGYNPNRMSWIKTNFLWMQYRSGWCRKKDQERCVAIKLKHEFFEFLLSTAVSSSENDKERLLSSDVRLQWDPDHNPLGEVCIRRAIQLGLRRNVLAEMILGKAVLDIVDITDFVFAQRHIADDRSLWKDLVVPVEREYKGGDIAANLQTNETSPASISPIPECCIFLGGGFNPLHTQHVELMHRVKEYLEKERNIRVRKGYFVPSHAGHIRKKDSSRVIKTEHRLAIINAAIKEYGWLECAERPHGSAAEYAKKIVSRGDMYAIVVGGDRSTSSSSRKWLQQLEHPEVLTVCVRRGNDGKGETAYRSYLRDLKERSELVNPNFVFLADQLNSVSSMAVREKISLVIETGDAKILHRLVDDKVIAVSTAQYIESNLSDLFSVE